MDLASIRYSTTTDGNLAALLIGMENSGLATMDMIHEQREEFRAMHRTLSDFVPVIILSGNRHDLRAVVVTTEGDPRSISMTGDLVDCVADADLVKQLGGVDTDADARADFFVFGGLLVDVDLDGGAPGSSISSIEGSIEDTVMV